MVRFKAMAATIAHYLPAHFLRYTLASLLALAVDYGCYLCLVSLRLFTIPHAAVAGYALGFVVSYFLMVEYVFPDGWLQTNRKVEFALFFLSGCLGMALTYGSAKAVVWLLGCHIQLAKITAIAVSFFGVYAFRKFFVFGSGGLLRRASMPARPESVADHPHTF